MPVDERILRGVPLFSGMTDASIEAVRSVALDAEFEAGDPIVSEGEPGDCFYVVVSGRARVERGGELVGELTAGDFFGEIALLDGRPRTATVTVTEHVHAAAIRRDDFRRLMEERPVIRLGVVEALTERIRRDGPAAGD